MLKPPFFSRFLKPIKRFANSESGMTLPLLAVCLSVLVGTVGLAVDIGRAQLVQSKLQFSLDAAGLAAGSTAKTTALVEEATKYLNANFDHYLGAALSDISITSNAKTTEITLSATATIDNSFMKALGVDTTALHASTKIGRQIQGLEVVILIDVSYGDDLETFKNGIKGFVDALFDSAAGVSENLVVSVVPYNHTLNIGPSHTSWIKSGSNASILARDPVGWGPTSWAGCVDVRDPAAMITDDPPTSDSTKWNQYYWQTDGADPAIQPNMVTKLTEWTDAPPSSWWHHTYNYFHAAGDIAAGPDRWEDMNDRKNHVTVTGKEMGNYVGLNIWHANLGGTETYASPLDTEHQGPNYQCPDPVLAQSTDHDEVWNAINNIRFIKGLWVGDLGYQMAWDLLSPRWRGLWGDASHPYDYNKPGWTKAIVSISGYGLNWKVRDPQLIPYGSGVPAIMVIDNHTRTAYDYLKTNSIGAARADGVITHVFDNMNDICTQLKRNNVYLYFLGYSPDGLTSNPAAGTCTTASNYNFWFTGRDWSAFDKALNSIADSLVKLRTAE